MKGHFIDFIEEKWIDILKFGFAYMLLQVLRYMKKKNFLIFWKQNGCAESLENTSVFFWTALDNERDSEKNEVNVCNFAPRAKNEKNSKIQKFEKFRFFEKLLRCLLHFYIYFQNLSRFCSGCKTATISGPAEEAVQKNGFICERFCAAILFSQNLLKFFHVP